MNMVISIILWGQKGDEGRRDILKEGVEIHEKIEQLIKLPGGYTVHVVAHPEWKQGEPKPKCMEAKLSKEDSLLLLARKIGRLANDNNVREVNNAIVEYNKILDSEDN